MNRNILAAILLFVGTSILWLVLCWNWWGRPVANNTTTEIQKQDSIINYNAGEYDRLLQEQIELYKQLRTYEDAQLTAKTTYQRTRSTILIRDTITIVDVIHLVNSCDSVIASDSLVINNLKGQLNIEGEKINNLQEVVGAYEQKTVLLSEEINTLDADKKKLEKQKKRRNHALVFSSSVAILSTFVLSILL
jgi:NifU-like protein involved in Fe-S cluster formation